MSKYRKEINQELFERIEQYLSGNMDADARQAFEAEVSADPKLREEVNLQRRLIAAVEISGFGEVDKTSSDMRIEKLTAKRSKSWFYAAAAIAALVFSYMGWRFFKPDDTGKTDLYATYFYPDPGLPVAMDMDTATYVFNEGMVSYKEGDYQRAIKTWNALSPSAVGSDTLRYYIAMAQLNDGDLTHAAKALHTLMAGGNTAFHERAVWYLALIRVKEKDYPAAISLLKQLNDSEDARQLLHAVQQKQSRKP